MSATPGGAGVDYVVSFTGDQAGLELLSSVNAGDGTFVGLPWNSGDKFALQFTLLSDTPSPGAYVSAGAVVNTRQSAAQSPVKLGGPYTVNVVSATPSDAKIIKKLGFQVYIAPKNSSAWPAHGATIRLRVEPSPRTTVIDTQSGAEYRDRLNAATVTLSQAAILALRQMPSPHRSLPAAWIVEKVAQDTGVEYTIGFPVKGTALEMDLTPDHKGPFLGLPGSVEHLAVRFTLISSTAGPNACLRAGLRLFVSPAFPYERLAGHTVRVLVEPTPKAAVAELRNGPE